jgi:hypothetical protein
MAEKQQSRKGKNHLDGLIRRPLPSSTERLLQVIQIFFLVLLAMSRKGR